MTRNCLVRWNLVLAVTVIGSWVAASSCAAGAGSDELAASGGSGGSGGALRDEPWEAPFGGIRECRMSAAECKWQYDTCTDNCWTSIDPGFDCLGSCRDAWCMLSTGSDEECALHTYHFDGGERIAELEEACLAAVSRDMECDERTVLEDCEAVATIESAEVIAAYTCVSESPCGASTEHCLLGENDELSDEICDAIDQSCDLSVCSQEFYNVLDQATPWWRQEVIDAARACIELLGCRETKSCLDAWSDAAFKNTGLEDISLWD